LYVDDILIFGTSLDVINEDKTLLCQSFDMKDMGEDDVILNIKLIKGENVITLMQSHYMVTFVSFLLRSLVLSYTVLGHVTSLIALVLLSRV
jgi:hypothetical protein